MRTASCSYWIPWSKFSICRQGSHTHTHTSYLTFLYIHYSFLWNFHITIFNLSAEIPFEWKGLIQDISLASWWILRCLTRLCFEEKHLPHCSHLLPLPSLCKSMWSFILDLSLNLLPHSTQPNCLSLWGGRRLRTLR